MMNPSSGHIKHDAGGAVVLLEVKIKKELLGPLIYQLVAKICWQLTVSHTLYHTSDRWQNTWQDFCLIYFIDYMQTEKKNPTEGTVGDWGKTKKKEKKKRLRHCICSCMSDTLLGGRRQLRWYFLKLSFCVVFLLFCSLFFSIPSHEASLHPALVGVNNSLKKPLSTFPQVPSLGLSHHPVSLCVDVYSCLSQTTPTWNWSPSGPDCFILKKKKVWIALGEEFVEKGVNKNSKREANKIRSLTKLFQSSFPLLSVPLRCW